jgi:hypothetical protein
MIIKEWECAAHGPYEAPEPSCPHGCPERFQRRVILTAPGTRSDKTKRADWAINALAEDYGYTDINNSPSRANSVAEFAKKHDKLKDQKPEWQDVPHADPGFSRDKTITVPTVTAAQFGAQPVSDAMTMLQGRKGRSIPTILHRAKE